LLPADNPRDAGVRHADARCELARANVELMGDESNQPIPSTAIDRHFQNADQEVEYCRIRAASLIHGREPSEGRPAPRLGPRATVPKTAP